MKTDDLSSEIECANALIKELSERNQKKNDMIKTLLKHKIRYQEVKDTIQKNYEDTISHIKTQIIQIEEVNKQKIHETQEEINDLSNSNESRNISIETIQDIIEKRKTILQNKIEETEKEALDYQQKIKSLKIDQENLLEENENIQSEINKINFECDLLQRQTASLEEDYNNSIQSLNDVIAKAQGIQEYYNEQIKINYDTMNENEVTIGKLSKILDFYQNHAKTNEQLFDSDDEESI